MNRALGIIITGGNNDKLKELSNKRSVSAIPYGGRYRAIDFVLSNMVNSGINKIGVVTQYSYRSLMDHLGSGKEWDLDRRTDGLYLFPPYLSGEGSGWYRGSADGMYHNISFLKKSKEEFVIVATGNCIFKADFNELVEEHEATGADISVCCRDMSDLDYEELKHFGIVQLGDEDRIVDLQEKPLNPKGSIASMGIYCIRRRLLIDLLEDSASKGLYDFVCDIMIRNLDKLMIKACLFKGYWRSMSSIPMFYKTNMELLNPAIRKELFMDNGRVFTKVKDETPAKYNDEAEVSNCIVADGCIIEGTVENSVLFRGVKIAKGVVIKDSIIMQDAVINVNARLTNVILDKEVVINEGKELKGEDNYPFVVGKGVEI